VFVKGPLIRAQLERLAQEWRQRRLPIVDGATPIVVTFHDVNEETAARLSEYLQLLVQGSEDLGLTVDARPFYDRRDDLERVAILRARRL
jgi:peptidoglycan-N-acetylglucosamine deacetylase